MNTPRLMSIIDTAKHLGIGRTKTLELVEQRELETVYIGRRRLVTVSSIEAFINKASKR